ncbi:MAG: hypothetical protein ACRBB0_27065 [Pelagimonas sp.]|uniref:hypothetical protein n=1 Tax=Pelagimonas sp. TaxID=2073170 RepID=UPI003D6B23B6
MKTVKLTKPFIQKLDASAKRTFPAGWTGPVDDDLFDDMTKGGFGEQHPKPEKKPARRKSSKAKTKTADEEKLAAAETVLSDAKAALEGAETDDDKAKAQSAVDAAEKALAELKKA